MRRRGAVAAVAANRRDPLLSILVMMAILSMLIKIKVKVKRWGHGKSIPIGGVGFSRFARQAMADTFTWL